MANPLRALHGRSMKRGSSQPEFSKSEVATSGRKADSALVELVRLLARQAARQWAESKPEAERPAPLAHLTEKQR
jgi:hypothetical protein